MPFLIAVAFVTFFGCVIAGLDRDASRALTATAHGLIGLAAIVHPRSRTAIFEFLKRFSAPAALFAALIMQGAIMSGAFFVGSAATPYRTEQAMVALAGVGLFFLAATGGATAAGRNRMTSALLWVPLALGVLTLLDWFDGRADFFGFVAPNADNRISGPFASPNEAATTFALFAVFATFAIVDELTRQPTAQVADVPPPTIARRLALPAAALVASFNMLVLSGSRAGIAAGVAGVAAYFFLAWRRGLKGRAGPRMVPATAAAVGALALLVAATSGAGALRRFVGAPTDADYYSGMTQAAMAAWRDKPLFGHGLGAYDVMPAAADGAPFDALRWLAETGLVGAALLVGMLGFVLWILWRAQDHGRRPSRGVALATGLIVVALVHGAATSALAAPAPTAVLAALLGVAVAYIDPLGASMKVKATARTRVLG